MRHTRTLITGAVGALAAFGLAPNADASFMFTQVSNNGNTPVAGQFWFDVVDRSDLAAGVVGLKVSNTGPVASTIAELHIEDDVNLFMDYYGTSADGSPAYSTGPGIDFGPPPPGNGNLPDAPAMWTTSYFATADPPPSAMGVDPGEEFELRLVLRGMYSFQDAVDFFAAGANRAGIHVISIDGEGSETFVTPTPGSVTLAAFGLGLGVLRRRRS